MGPTLGPSGADRTQVGPMVAPWTLLSGKPIHNHCWYIVNSNSCFILRLNSNLNKLTVIQENSFENVVCQMSAVFPRPECVNSIWQLFQLKWFALNQGKELRVSGKQTRLFSIEIRIDRLAYIKVIGFVDFCPRLLLWYHVHCACQTIKHNIILWTKIVKKNW